MAQVTTITSRGNPLLVRLRKLAADPAAYRKMGEVWIEGEHLCGPCAPGAFPQRKKWKLPMLLLRAPMQCFQ